MSLNRFGNFEGEKDKSKNQEAADAIALPPQVHQRMIILLNKIQGLSNTLWSNICMMVLQLSPLQEQALRRLRNEDPEALLPALIQGFIQTSGIAIANISQMHSQFVEAWELFAKYPIQLKAVGFSKTLIYVEYVGLLVTFLPSQPNPALCASETQNINNEQRQRLFTLMTSNKYTNN